MSSGLLGSTERIRGAFTEEDGAGARKGGVIIEPFPYQSQRWEFGPNGGPEVWPDGKPKMQIIVTVQSDERLDAEDDGRRRFYLKGRRTDLHDKVAAAVAATGANDFEIGGTLFVTRKGKGQAKTVGGPRPWVYEVEYSRPRSSGLAAKSTVLGRSEERQTAAKATDDEPPF